MLFHSSTISLYFRDQVTRYVFDAPDWLIAQNVTHILAEKSAVHDSLKLLNTKRNAYYESLASDFLTHNILPKQTVEFGVDRIPRPPKVT